VHLYLKANVTIPDVEVSSEQLRFGTVYVGHMRAIYVQLSNTKEIPANWSFGTAIASEGGAPKPTDDFTVIPVKGLLNPGETCNVQIIFHPRTIKNYAVKIPLKVRCLHTHTHAYMHRHMHASMRGLYLPLGRITYVHTTYICIFVRNLHLSLTLQVSQNPTKRIIKIMATSDSMKIRFDPPMLDMDAILPYVQVIDYTCEHMCMYIVTE
jgi:hypothetical protein